MGRRTGWMVVGAVLGAFALAGCGESASASSKESLSAAACESLPPRQCELDLPGQCSATTRTPLDLERECYVSSTEVACMSADACDAGRWFGISSGGTPALFVGCTNAPFETTPLDIPDEDLELIAGVRCDELSTGIGHEACMEFAAEECPVEDGCSVYTRNRVIFDGERACTSDEVVSDCVGFESRTQSDLARCY